MKEHGLGSGFHCYKRQVPVCRCEVFAVFAQKILSTLTLSPARHESYKKRFSKKSVITVNTCQNTRGQAALHNLSALLGPFANNSEKTR